jgi:hypothetical protein
MKKLALSGAALILALALTACDMGNIPGEAALYNEDGQRMVTLTINTGGEARALASDTAKAAVDFYEVVFSDGTKFYRAAAAKDKPLKVAVPVGDYRNGSAADPTRAILLAGRNSDKTLLATGLISKVNASTNKGEIKADTVSVTFTLTALTTDLLKTPKSSLTFSSPTTLNTPSGAAAVNGLGVPYFKVPADTSGIAATLSIGGFKTGAIDTSAALYAKVTNPPIGSAGLSSQEGDPPVLVSGEVTLTADAVVPATGALPITIATPSAGHTDGLSRFWIDVPVYALNPVNSVEWHIRNGLDNSLLDDGLGLGKNTLGGSILLAVGATTAGAITIVNTGN